MVAPSNDYSRSGFPDGLSRSGSMPATAQRPPPMQQVSHGRPEFQPAYPKAAPAIELTRKWVRESAIGGSPDSAGANPSKPPCLYASGFARPSSRL